MPDPGALGEIYDQIMAGKPQTLHDIGKEFNDVLVAVQEVEGELPKEKERLAGYWQGAAATAFGEVSDQLTGFLGDTATAIGQPAWQGLMDAAGDGLTQAQTDIQALSDEWNKYVAEATAEDPFVPDMAAWDAAAKAILGTVSGIYEAQGAAMKPVKEDPGDVGPGGGADAGDDAGEPAAGEPAAGEPDAGGAPGDEPPGADGEPGAGEEPGELGGPDGPGGPGENDLTFDPAGDGPGGDLDGPGGEPGGEFDPLGGADGTPAIGGPNAPSLIGPEPADGDAATPPELAGIGSADNPADDPSTTLTSFDPSASSLIGPSPAGGGEVPSTLTSAPNAGSTGPSTGPGSAPAVPGARPLVGIGPSSQLTSAGSRGAGGSPSLQRRAVPGGGPTGPSSTLTSAGGPGRSAQNRRRRGGEDRLGSRDGAGHLSRGVGGLDEDADERETWLLGDEEWDDSQALDAAIGRPGSDGAAGA